MPESRKLDESSLSDLRKEVVRLRSENKRLAAQQPHPCAVYDAEKGKITERCESFRCGGVFFICARHGCTVGLSDFCSMYRKEAKTT